MTKDRKHIREARQALLEGVGIPEAATFIPDPFQTEAIESLKSETDTLVIAPTGTGKTYIATEAIDAVIREGKRAVYTAPLKALSNSKYAEFKKRFEPEFTVGLLTGDRKIEGDASVVVATTEIYRNDLYSMRGDYSLVVLDEFHYLADPQRGPVWEESVILSPKSATLLMLSASISNPHEIVDWMKEIRGKDVRVVQVDERPVELRLGFLHPDFGVIPLAGKDGRQLSEVTQYYGRGEARGGYRSRRRQFGNAPRRGPKRGGRGRGRKK